MQRMPTGYRTSDKKFNAGFVLLGLQTHCTRLGERAPDFRTQANHSAITQVTEIENLLMVSLTHPRPLSAVRSEPDPVPFRSSPC